MRSNNRLSLLIQLEDGPGALEAALHVFSKHGINLTHIESRPSQGSTFDIYVDCEGKRGTPAVDALLTALNVAALKVFVLDEKNVPWFPRHITELNRIATNVLDAGKDLTADHPGFNDAAYRERRAHIDALARNYRYGGEVPLVEYTEEEISTWREVYTRLMPLHKRFACDEYLRAFEDMQSECGYSEDRIPQGRDINRWLTARTGFRIWPVAGLLSSRDFLNGLAFRVFFSTQYIRHHSKPLYTPEPDVCHELIGHAPMFGDAAFADLSQEIGLASLGASDEEVEQLARCYWHSVEFGLLGSPGNFKAYGAGLLSSFGELEYACTEGESGPAYKSWEPEQAAHTDFPITEYQPLYFVASSLQDAKSRMYAFCRNMKRPFHARYVPATQRIWVDRAVHRTAG